MDEQDPSADLGDLTDQREGNLSAYGQDHPGADMWAEGSLQDGRGDTRRRAIEQIVRAPRREQEGGSPFAGGPGMDRFVEKEVRDRREVVRQWRKFREGQPASVRVDRREIEVIHVEAVLGQPLGSAHRERLTDGRRKGGEEADPVHGVAAHRLDRLRGRGSP